MFYTKNMNHSFISLSNSIQRIIQYNFFSGIFNSKNHSITFFTRKFNSKIDSKIRIWLYSIQQNNHSIRQPRYRPPLLWKALVKVGDGCISFISSNSLKFKQSGNVFLSMECSDVGGCRLLTSLPTSSGSQRSGRQRRALQGCSCPPGRRSPRQPPSSGSSS